MENNQLNTDPDFVMSQRDGNSLKGVIRRYPEGVPSHLAAKVLGLRSKHELEAEFGRIVKKLRSLIFQGREDEPDGEG